MEALEAALKEPELDAAARLVWEYHQLNHTLQKADVIMALGSNDPRVADRAAELYHAGYAPILLFSGGVGKLTEGLYGGKSEAAYFAELARKAGVPDSAILVEGASTNTGENIRFSRALLAEHGVKEVTRVLLVQKPYMERRSYATFAKQWPGLDPAAVQVTSPRISYDAYPVPGAPGLSRGEIVSVAVGDLQRIRVYPRQGFQVEQDMPADVWAAWKRLVSAGFDGHLVRDAAGAIVAWDEA